MAHLLKSESCDLCHEEFKGNRFYIHSPTYNKIQEGPNCEIYHGIALKQAKQNFGLNLADNITKATVGTSTLAVAAGRLATVGKIGTMTSKALGGAMAGFGVATSIIGIVDAATEKAPELPKCDECGGTECEAPGCILFCNTCGHETDSWRNATKKKHCLEICSDCNSKMDVCFNCCEKSPTVTSCHWKFNVAAVHGSLSTHLYGTCKAGRITGDSLTIAGTAACFIPVIGWFAGPALIAGGVGTNIGASCANERVVKVRCSSCSREEPAETFDKLEGCRSMCMCCGVLSNDKSKFCVRLCAMCKGGSCKDFIC